MKKEFIILLLFVITLCKAYSQTQFANSGFESWETYQATSISVPSAPWAIVTEIPAAPPVVTGTKTTDAYTGTFAINLTPYTADGSNSVLLAIEGNYTNFSDKPTSFGGYYKYAPAGGDEVVIQVQLVKTTADPDAPDEIASGSIVITNAAATYTFFNVPLTYIDFTTIPDRAQVTFSMNHDQTTDGTLFTLDDLNFSYTTGIRNYESSLKKIQTGLGFAKFCDTNRKANWKVYDISGKILAVTGTVSEIDISYLPSGIYFVEVLDEDGNSFLIKVIN